MRARPLAAAALALATAGAAAAQKPASAPAPKAPAAPQKAAPAPAARTPLPVADAGVASWASGWFPWGEGEVGVAKGARTVPGWSAWTVTKRYTPGFEDRVDALVSQDGKTALLGNLFLDEERIASPAPIATDADLAGVRQLLKDRVLGPAHATITLVPSRDLPGLKALSVGLETGYGPYDLPAYVSAADGTVLFLGSVWRRDQPIPEQRRSAIDLSATPVEGPADARVTIVEYSDMECPMCKKRSSDLSALVDRLKGELTIRRYVKNYPLTQIHPWSFRAASASRCFLKKDPRLFFSFRSNVFSRQEQLDVAALDAFAFDFATANGVPGALPGCYLDDRNDAPILKDLSEGFAMGVRSTPTYFVDGTLIVWMDENLFEEFLRKTYLGGKGLPLKPAPTPTPAKAAAKH